MITRNDLKCPTCGSYDLKQAYELEVGDKWTTRDHREKNNLRINSIQKLLVPPKDDTWFGCNMCGNEFDGDGNLYLEKKWFGLYKTRDMVKVYPEICCEICNEVIHNHFDCPVCKCQTETDVYGNFDNEVTEFACERCKTKFEVISRDVESFYIKIEIKEV